MIEKRFSLQIDYDKAAIKIYEHERSDVFDSWRLMYSQYLDTKEQRIREALIALGWTPPQEK